MSVDPKAKHLNLTVVAVAHIYNVVVNFDPIGPLNPMGLLPFFILELLGLVITNHKNDVANVNGNIIGGKHGQFPSQKLQPGEYSTQ